MDNRMTQTLLMDALTAAYWKKKPALGLMHHSDRGSQYYSAAYRAVELHLRLIYLTYSFCDN